MDISIAVMFFNKPIQTIECLASFKENEIYLLNNGSSLEATQLVEAYIKGKINIHYRSNPKNLGVAKGRNQLINIITSEWIFFVDNDITITTKKWETILKIAIKDNPSALVYIPKLFNQHLGAFEKFYAFLVQNNKVATYVSLTGRSNKISGGASIINRKLFEINGLYNENFFVGFEDFEFALRAIKAHRDFDVLELPEIILNHNHKKVTTLDDNDYLKIRYNADQINKSYELIKEIHGLELQDNGVEWSKNKIKQMENNNIKENTEPSHETGKNKPIRVTLYTENQVKIGGIETFNINFCKRMSKYYDITFLCKTGDSQSLRNISQYADVVIYTGQHIETDIFIYGIAWGNRPSENITAKKYIQMLHGDYEWMKNALHFEYTKMPNVTQHIAVGKNVQEKFKKMTGYDSEVIYNLLDTDIKIEKVLKLISIMRLGKEKGLERIEIMARELKKVNKKFIWHIYGDGTEIEYVNNMKLRLANIKEVVFMGINLNPQSLVADSDYLVALSNSEGFSYSIYEALQIGTPCIVTNFPSAYEQVEDGVSGYILNMDMSNLNIERIYNKIPKSFKFLEKSSEKDWINILGGEGKEIRIDRKINNLPELIQVKSLIQYTDLEENRRVYIGEVLSVSVNRANELVSKNIVEII